MNTIKSMIILMSVALGVILTSCDKDEPTLPNEGNEWNNDNPMDEPDYPSQVEDGSQILGSWYYLSPDNALKISIRFTPEQGSWVRDKTCYISVDSKFPHYLSDYENAWSYDNKKWEIRRLQVASGISGSPIIENIFEDEMWLDLNYGIYPKRLKFKRTDMGPSSYPTGRETAPDGFFGNYVWTGNIKGANISFKFTSRDIVEEVSDTPIYIDKWVTTSKHEAMFFDGCLKFDWDKSIIAAAAGSSFFVVVRKSAKEVDLYNQFEPYNVYTFKR